MLYTVCVYVYVLFVYLWHFIVNLNNLPISTHKSEYNTHGVTQLSSDFVTHIIFVVVVVVDREVEKNFGHFICVKIV